MPWGHTCYIMGDVFPKAIQATPWEMLSSPGSYTTHYGRSCLLMGYRNHIMGYVVFHRAIQAKPWDLLSSTGPYKRHHGRCLPPGHTSHTMGDSVFARSIQATPYEMFSSLGPYKQPHNGGCCHTKPHQGRCLSHGNTSHTMGYVIFHRAIQATPWDMLSSTGPYKPHSGRWCLPQGHKSHIMGDVVFTSFLHPWAPFNISSLSLYSTPSCPLNQNSCFPHRKQLLFLHINLIT